MSDSRRLRRIALALVVMSSYMLARPNSASAAPQGAQCGVCYPTLNCPTSTSTDCSTFCGSSVASSCVFGIPGGWTCFGQGTYSSFVYCGLGEE